MRKRMYPSRSIRDKTGDEMKLVLGILILVLALVAGWFLTRPPELAMPEVAPPVATAPEPPPVAAEAQQPPQAEFPIDRVVISGEGSEEAHRQQSGQAEEAEPVPPLDASDERVASWMSAAVAGPARALLAGSGLVRRVVATVDNLSQEKSSVRLWPVATAHGLPVVDERGGEIVLAPANAARYKAFVELAETVDVDALVAGYKTLYPVFQQAYQELGYPTGNFNDRLVAVIDHLLAAPEVEGPIRLVQPKVIYQFADPQLEALSAGQKIMLRVGPDNERRIKARLRVIRQRLAGRV